ncbi:MAG: hypothetical protein HIU91_13845, partial [Acidobacteria bacterium]|nr:hypothetical protein [Acidobacteriota bacterium]
MAHSSNTLRSVSARIAALPSPILFILLFAAVALSHLTLLHLPYYWDEGGYYIPAALDFYRNGQIIPHYTNAHPPIPNILLGTLWHIVGYHILATRLFVAAVAATSLLAIFRLTQRLLDAPAALAATLLTAVYPIWFAQSTLAQADIFAAAFTLWAFALYLHLPAAPTSASFAPEVLSSFAEGGGPASLPRTSVRPCPPECHEEPALPQHLFAIATLFSLAALAKETAI